jgi:hypothetical protein
MDHLYPEIYTHFIVSLSDYFLNFKVALNEAMEC